MDKTALVHRTPMKTSIHPRRPLIAIAASLVLLSAPAQALIVAITSNPSSYSNITFNDTASFNPSNQQGITVASSFVPSSWSGTLNTLVPTVDPVTMDVGGGDMSATFAGTNYNILLNNVQLDHQAGNTGHAVLSFRFRVEFLISTAGLASQPTISPVFLATGNVSNAKAGAYAQLTGQIDYFVTGNALPVDTVTYAWSTTSPGPFSQGISGTAAVGTTPALNPGDTLTLEGSFDLLADPTTISLQTIPEPGSAALLLGAGGLLLRRRRAEG